MLQYNSQMMPVMTQASMVQMAPRLQQPQVVVSNAPPAGHGRVVSPPALPQQQVTQDQQQQVIQGVWQLMLLGLRI